MEKKTIYLKYTDHSSKVKNQTDGPFYDILSERYDIVFSDNPDYVIYGPFGDDHLKYSNAIKIAYTGECICPDFNLCDYGIGFDHIEFKDRYLRYPLWLLYGSEKNQRMMNKNNDISENLIDREFCSMVVSNDFADPMRDKIYEAVSGYKKVNSGGRYRNNIDEPEGVRDKLDFQRKHKFALALENCSYSGYTTEKLMEAFEAKTVPIYWGDPDVTNEFNPKSFINYHNFNSIDEFLMEIKRVDSDDNAYMEMLREPSLIDNRYQLEAREKELKEFLYNIFDQEKSEAYRRNMECWGKKYTDIQYRKKSVFDKHQHRKTMIKNIFRIAKKG